ncbi:MAG: sulfite exporter TauE/SafE family protein [Anaerolineae bacterium]|nr:sulfite exporter TauE/SafE family protein [Anaerolineae bacterium]
MTTTLMGTGYHPRFAIGSVNLVEFFVALAASITFFIALKEISWPSTVGLIIGGVPAAPLAALMSKRMSPQKLMLFVGSLIILLSVRNVLVTLA